MSPHWRTSFAYPAESLNNQLLPGIVQQGKSSQYSVTQECRFISSLFSQISEDLEPSYGNIDILSIDLSTISHKFIYNHFISS